MTEPFKKIDAEIDTEIDTEIDAQNRLSQAEETLRQLARLSPPEGIEDRIHHRLAVARQQSQRKGFWTLWAPARRLQFAGAGLVAVAVVVSTWSVYRHKPQPTPQAIAPAPLVVAPAPRSSSGFSTAGAERRPPTLAPLKIQPAPKRKPSASHASSRTQKPAASGDSAAKGSTAQVKSPNP